MSICYCTEIPEFQIRYLFTKYLYCIPDCIFKQFAGKQSEFSSMSNVFRHKCLSAIQQCWKLYRFSLNAWNDYMSMLLFLNSQGVIFVRSKSTTLDRNQCGVAWFVNWCRDLWIGVTRAWFVQQIWCHSLSTDLVRGRADIWWELSLTL